MAPQEEFLEKAERVVRLSDKLRKAIDGGRIGGQKVQEYERLIAERISELKKLELESFDRSIIELTSSRDDLEYQRSSANLSDEAYFPLAENLRTRVEELEAERRNLEGLSGLDYMVLLKKRARIVEASSPDRLASESRQRMLESFGIRIRSGELDDDARIGLIMVVCVVGLKYGLVSGSFSVGIIPYVTYALAALAGILSLVVATVGTRVKDASMKNAFIAFLSIFIVLAVVGIVSAKSRYMMTIMTAVNVSATFLMVRRVYFLQATEAIWVVVVNFVAYTAFLWALGVHLSFLIKV